MRGSGLKKTRLIAMFACAAMYDIRVARARTEPYVRPAGPVAPLVVRRWTTAVRTWWRSRDDRGGGGYDERGDERETTVHGRR